MGNERGFRIAATADWHFGERIADEKQLEQLLEAISSAEPDLLLVLGDIVGFHRPKELRSVFMALARLACPVAVVFGNHDLWLAADSELANSWKALESFCGLATDAGLHTLDLAPLRVGPLFLCGSGWWYDYSLGLPAFSRAQYQAKNSGGAVWNDAFHVRWGKPDEEVCRELADRLEEQLARTPPDVEPIVATHMAILPGSVPMGGGPVWDYYSAFWGSSLLAKVLKERGVRLHLHGHVHGEGIRVPSVTYNRDSGLLSCNASLSKVRPFILCDRPHAATEWVVVPGNTLGF